MIRVTCDGCDKTIDRDGDAHYRVDYENAPYVGSPDPVAQMNEAEQSLVATLRIGGGDGEFHFCSASCLAGWGFKQTLEDS